MNDPVTAPAHYLRPGGIEPLEFLMTNGVTYPEADIIQYVFRWRLKGGLQDLEKAEFYLKRLIEHERKKELARIRDANPQKADATTATAAQIDLVDWLKSPPPPPPMVPIVGGYCQRHALHFDGTVCILCTPPSGIPKGPARKTSLQE